MASAQKILRRFAKRWRYVGLAWRHLGPRAALRYWLAGATRRIGSVAPRRLYSKYLEHPVWFRPAATDLAVFKQIMVEREYRCVDDIAAAALIIDCGANVGYSSAYLLSRYPEAELIAVEPDPDNFELLERNLAPFGNRATLIQSGVWSHPARLRISETRYGGGGEWGVQVRECGDDEPGGFTAVDVGTLLEQSGHARIAILKIDIEGAEGVVFAQNFQAWLERVDCLLVELHDDSQFGDCRAIFASAIQGQNFELDDCGELTVCRRAA